MATIIFATSQKISEWQESKEREGGGTLFPGPELSCVAGAGQTNGESKSGLISHRMHRQWSAGLRSKWELVHYGSAARYFTSDLENGKDEKVVVTD